MKRLTQLLLLAAFLASSSLSYASLTNAWWHDDQDGALVCTDSTWSSANSELTMYGVQYQPTGNLLGAFSASGTEDPRATKSYYIDNSTGQTWVGYNVDVYMDKAFSISNVVSTLPGDWTYSVTQPVPNSSPLYYGSSEYVGHITYNCGTPVIDGAELDFAYDVGFSGSMTYNFEDTLSPIMVPEPGTLSLAAMGACLLVGLARRRPNSP